ncbi:MAG TPA: serine/threonine-protein kinase [Anaerolineales bacterium]|jgi:hypothetical protein
MIDRLDGRTLGDYHILEKVGQGGMTTVYKALDLARSRVVALKVLSPYIAQDEGFKTRFQREIELLGKMRHPNIVPILSFGEEDHYAYIVMPYIQKGTLQDRMRVSPMDPFQAGRLMNDLTAALSFAHGKGIVHRDVKASNILIDDSGHALLSDFGFAHISDLSLSLTGSALIGTPAFMSPEQCKGEPVDARSDQYSLGIVLYQMFTGKLPFDGDTPMAVAVQHINEPLPRPRRVNPDVPEKIEQVLVKALSKKAEHRYPDIEAMNAAFQEALQSSVNELGHFVPPASNFHLATWIAERTPFGDSLSTVSNLWRTRRRALVVVALLLLTLPTAGFALASVMTTEAGRQLELTGGQDLALQATIDALATSIAGESGQGVDPSVIQAAVAGTMSAMARVESGRPTITPGFLETLTAQELVTDQAASATPSPTGGTSGSGDGQPGGGPGPSGTPTKTATPGSSSTPGPTSTPLPPTATPAPPTATPVPPTATPVPPTATELQQCWPSGNPVKPTCAPPADP